MVRVAGIWRQIDAGITQPGPDGRTPRQLLEALSRRIHELAARQHRVFHQVIEPLLNAEGIFILKPEDLDEVQRDYTRDYFERNLLPAHHPPGGGHRATPSRAWATGSWCSWRNWRRRNTWRRRTCRFRPWPSSTCPPPARRGSCGCPRPPAGTAFVMLEDVVRLHLEQVFQGYAIRNCHALRVTRDSDLPVEEDPSEDLMKMVEEHLRSRRRGARWCACSTSRG